MADRREHLDPRSHRKIRDFLVAGQRVRLRVGLEGQPADVPVLEGGADGAGGVVVVAGAE